jgi:hypothetical protein
MRTSLRFSVFLHALVIAAFVTASPYIYIILGGVIGYALIRNTSIFYNLNGEEILVAIIYLATILFGVVVNFFEAPIVAYHLFMITLTLLTAVIFTRNPTIYYYSSKICLITFQIILLLFAVFKGFANFPAEVPFENMIEGASANGVTSYMVLLQLNFLLVRFFLFRKVTFITASITLIVALIGYGRGSIVSAFLILLVCVFVHYSLKNKVKFISYMLASIFFVILVISYYFDEIMLFLNVNTKLGAGIVDIERAQIISEYLGKINWHTFFTGADYTNTSVITEFNGNPHNSFIRAHHIFGFPYLLFVILFPFYSIFKRKGVLEIFFYTSVLLILFFRAFSEPIIFPTLFDFYFFSMFLLIIRNRSTSLPVIAYEA